MSVVCGPRAGTVWAQFSAAIATDVTAVIKRAQSLQAGFD
jgi:hypothetical protein